MDPAKKGKVSSHPRGEAAQGAQNFFAVFPTFFEVLWDFSSPLKYLKMRACSAQLHAFTMNIIRNVFPDRKRMFSVWFWRAKQRKAESKDIKRKCCPLLVGMMFMLVCRPTDRTRRNFELSICILEHTPPQLTHLSSKSPMLTVQTYILFCPAVISVFFWCISFQIQLLQAPFNRQVEPEMRNIRVRQQCQGLE